ncbi:unnamed protein product [Rhizoctonia solani]|uniref:Uncharacterized protein n=1 Tax=Rhizoctonia solani TaxID=456999 RepID=A0A8H3AKQ7_9AGAM|nr:unnamed protein product [Rhizoctonia solani]
MAVNESKITTPQAVLADLCPSVHTIFLQVKKCGFIGVGQTRRWLLVDLLTNAHLRPQMIIRHVALVL